jgi:peroxiredoxin
MRRDNLYKLPESIIAPVDDGACDHLLGMRVPSISLRSTSGGWINLVDIPTQRAVVYCYPRTGVPDEEPPGGLEAWNAIPGARGCTPQSCAFRDHFNELQALNATVFGLSTQTTEYQQEMRERLHLPFEVVSDSELTFTEALRLPTLRVGPERLIKRLTLIIEDENIIKVFYPVFPPDKNAEEVIAWLLRHTSTH